MVDNANAGDRKKQRSPRSPNYPSMGLNSAIGRLRDLYDRDGRAAVDNDVAVKALGYGSVSGAAQQTISTLTQFGLIERAGKQKIKISDLGLDILMPKSPDDRKRALKESAGCPAIFHELEEEYPTGLPSDEALIANLIRRETPFKRESAARLIKSFRETQELIKTSDNEAIDKPIPIAVEVRNNASQHNPTTEIKENSKTDVFALEKDKAVFSWPQEITENDYEDIIAWMDILKNKIKRSIVVKN